MPGRKPQLQKRLRPLRRVGDGDALGPALIVLPKAAAIGDRGERVAPGIGIAVLTQRVSSTNYVDAETHKTPQDAPRPPPRQSTTRFYHCLW